jgi:hypothetical protein
MHDVLRSRLLRHIEALPEAQLYQALDYVEFLASKYARDSLRQPGTVQKFGELLEDKMRGQGLAMGTIRGTLGVLGSADRFFSGISEAGKTIIRTVENGVTTATDTVTGGARPAGDDDTKQLPGSSAGPPQP